MIKRQALLRQRAGEDLLTQAKKRARQLYDEAAGLAALSHEDGYRAGYAEGLRDSVVALAQGLEGAAELQRRLEEVLQERIRETLEPLFASDEMLLSILDELLRSEPVPTVKRLRVHLPTAARGVRQAVVRRLDAAGLQAQVLEAADGRRLVIEWGEQLWAFDPPEALALSSATVLRSLRRSARLEDACARVRPQVIEALVAGLSAASASFND